jgi:hypothetical protein
MNAFQQNHFPKIESLVDLASIPVAEKLFGNPSYYKLVYKKLPVELKAFVFSALSKLLTKRVHTLLRADHPLQGISLFTNDNIVTREDVSRSKYKLMSRLLTAGAATFLSIMQDYLIPKAKEVVSMDVLLPIVLVLTASYVVCAGFGPDIPDKLSPQRQLIPELTQLLNIIQGIVQSMTSNEMKDVPQNVSEAPELISLKRIFNDPIPVNSDGNYSYSREQFRNILIDFNALSKKFTPEFYQAVLVQVFDKLKSESEIDDIAYKEILDHLVYKTPAELVEVKVDKPVVATHSGCQFLPPPKPVIALKRKEQLTEIKITEATPTAIHRKSS